MGESQEAFDRLRLIRSDNIGPVTYQQLIRRFGSAARALEAIPDLAMMPIRPFGLNWPIHHRH